ncbi:transposase DNA-binding-containing protein [Massilia eurypsychrophila]|uniref:transposase DNA-binding-containing protein n=1 Tax=Massilia eurypsychrophila TaxID=1485217 RepID=UPI001034EED3
MRARSGRKLHQTSQAEPTLSIPKACNGWAETLAAHRLFDNASIDWRAIMAPHWEQTEQRMAALACEWRQLRDSATPANRPMPAPSKPAIAIEGSVALANIDGVIG